MEIGSVGELSTYEKEYYTKKAISLSITAFILICTISAFIIANYTSLFERKVFERIATKYEYELSYSNNYELLDNDNAKQGNYIQLTDKENGIYILFRYDEDSAKIIEVVDDITNNASLYEVSTTIEDGKRIKSEEEIIYNIDKEFNSLNKLGLSSTRNSTGGGYSITKIDNIMGQHRINYMSNLLSSVNEHSDMTSATSTEHVLAVKNWFDYDNSINYQLGILKEIVETEAEYDSSVTIMYSGDTSENGSSATIIGASDSTSDTMDCIDDTEETETDTETCTNEASIDKSLEGFIGDKEALVEKYGDSVYSTYTSMIINSSTESDGLLSSDTVTLTDGIIIGTCINSEESINKMTSTMNVLVIVSYLERTIIL